MKVIIIGGGIGGLALAAGLKKYNFDTVVVEKDTDLSVTAGYHITLHKEVQEALEKLLPAENFEKILASAADGKKRLPNVFWDWRGRLIYKTRPETDPGIDIDRITLRVLLGEAVGGNVMLGRRCQGYQVVNNEVVALLDDGTNIKGDILVACDGTHSTIIKQLWGQQTNRPTGIVGVSGRTPAAALDTKLREKFAERSSMAMGAGGLSLYLGYFDPVHMSVISRPDLRASFTKEATYIWGAMFPESEEILKLKDKKPLQIQSEIIKMLDRHGWAEPLLEVIKKSEVAGIAMYQFNAASADPKNIAPEKFLRIVGLGDAIHATPPTAGMGAGIAIRDAEELVSELVKVKNGETLMDSALERYRQGMKKRAAKAIEAAMGIIKVIKFTDTLAGKVITKITLSAMSLLCKKK